MRIDTKKSSRLQFQQLCIWKEKVNDIFLFQTIFHWKSKLIVLDVVESRRCLVCSIKATLSSLQVNCFSLYLFTRASYVASHVKIGALLVLPQVLCYTHFIADDTGEMTTQRPWIQVYDVK